MKPLFDRFAYSGIKINHNFLLIEWLHEIADEELRFGAEIDLGIWGWWAITDGCFVLKGVAGDVVLPLKMQTSDPSLSSEGRRL